MFKKYFILFLFLILTNCSTPGAALLGPAFTGATTKSVARATVSFGSNQVIKKIANLPQNQKNKNQLNFHE